MNKEIDWAYANVNRLVHENKAVLQCVITSGGNKLESIGADSAGLAWLIAQAIYQFNKDQQNAKN